MPNDIVSVSGGIAAVVNDAQFVEAGEIVKALASLESEISASYGPLKKAAHDAHKAVCEEEKKKLGPVQTERVRVKMLMGCYSQAREAQARESRRIESERLEAEQARAAAQVDSCDPLAVALAIESVPAQSVTTGATLPKTGVALRTYWMFEIVNASIVPRFFCSPDERKIRACIEAHKQDAVIDGVRIWAEKR